MILVKSQRVILMKQEIHAMAEQGDLHELRDLCIDLLEATDLAGYQDWFNELSHVEQLNVMKDIWEEEEADV